MSATSGSRPGHHRRQAKHRNCERGRRHFEKFDDDDYYHPGFLEMALAHLPVKNRDRSIVAWDCFLALERGDPQVRFSGHGWKVGATLCFTRALWERHPFRDLPALGGQPVSGGPR